MPVQITINGENAAEAIKELSTLAAGISNQSVSTLTVGITTQEKPTNEKPVKARPKTEITKEPSRTTPESQNGLEVEPVDNDSDMTDEPVPTVVELRAKAQEIGKTPEGKKSIKDLLVKFGSKSISDIPDDRRAAFLRALEELADEA